MSYISLSEAKQLVAKWSPKKEFKHEKEFRDALYDYLQKQLNKKTPLSTPFHTIHKESGRGLADIGIDDKIGIELKVNLDSKREVDRLIGQVGKHLQSYRDVLIVICGDRHQEQIEDLKSRSLPKGGFGSPHSVDFIDKSKKIIISKISTERKSSISPQ